MITKDTFISTMTVGQFEERFFRNQQNPAPVLDTTKKRYAYGLKGIAETFDCSIPTAMRIKKSGVIDAAITQIGRKIVLDVELALELAGKAKGGRK